jgi:hypothetical protein
VSHTWRDVVRVPPPPHAAAPSPSLCARAFLRLVKLSRALSRKGSSQMTDMAFLKRRAKEPEEDAPTSFGDEKDSDDEGAEAAVR